MPAYKYYNDVGLAHCDLAGIVFLPRYTEMMCSVIENWFDEALDWPMAQMVGADRVSLAMLDVNTSYPSASRLGDRLTWKLYVEDIGRSSMKLHITAYCGDDVRLRCTLTMVLAEIGALKGRRWPDEILARAKEFRSPAEVA